MRTPPGQEKARLLHVPPTSANLSVCRAMCQDVLHLNPGAQTMAFPLAITLASNRIDALIDSDMVAYCNERVRRMRVERVSCLKTIVHFLLKHACLQHDGAFLFIYNKNKGRPITVHDISKNTHIHERNIERCLYDLSNSGLLCVEKQFKRITDNGIVLVAPVIRSFSKAFWKALNLWKVFIEDVRMAQSRTKIIFNRLIYRKNRGKLFTREQPTIAALQALQCRQMHGEQCSGGYAAPHLCELCRRLR